MVAMGMFPALIATLTMALDILTEITIVTGLVIVRGTAIVVRVVIVNHGMDPGAGDDLKNSKGHRCQACLHYLNIITEKNSVLKNKAWQSQV